MKTVVSISMSFVFLFQGVATDMDLCDQIEKISDFIGHYEEHKAYDGDSFFEFLVEDYLNDIGDKEGHHKNSGKEKMPNHANHQCCHPLVFVTPSNTIAIKTLIFKTKSQYNHYSFHFNSRFLESIFQPPKV